MCGVQSDGSLVHCVVAANDLAMQRNGKVIDDIVVHNDARVAWVGERQKKTIIWATQKPFLTFVESCADRGQAEC